MTPPSARAKKVAEEIAAELVGIPMNWERAIDRVARALDAERDVCVDAAWEHRCKGYSENCDCRGEIITAIRALAEEEA